jgi:hypothetical protein
VRFLVGDHAIENKSKDEILMTREFDSGKFSNLSDAELETVVALARKASTQCVAQKGRLGSSVVHAANPPPLDAP